MRKSSTGGTGRLAGIPSRVKNETSLGASSKNRPSSLDQRQSSGTGRLSHASRPRSMSRDSLSRMSFQSKSGAGSSHASKPRSSSRDSTSRMSFLPKSGRPSSGIGVRGRTDIPKDTRPNSDKRYQQQCISELLEFLISRNYRYPVSHKLLASPSNKDFFLIFEFVMGHLWTGYKQVPKMQDEVPHILKLVGYPFIIAKTYLSSVGCPHTWPHLLAALTWLIQMVKLEETIGQPLEVCMFEPSEGAEFDSVPDEKICFDYKEKTFLAFMSGQNEFDEENEAVKDIFMENHHGGNIQEIIRENERLQEKKQERDGYVEAIKALKEELQGHQQEHRQLNEFLYQLQTHKKVRISDLEKKIEEKNLLESDLQKETKQLEKLQILYEQQDLKPADVERMKAEQEQLQFQVDQEDKKLNDIATDIWQLNMDQAKKNEKLGAEVANYNRLAYDLKIAPENAEFADGKDFKLYSGVLSDVTGDFHTNVKPKLVLMKKSLDDQYRLKKKDHFKLTCDVEKMQDIVNEQRQKQILDEEELNQLEADIKTLVMASQTIQKTEVEKRQQQGHQMEQLEATLKEAKAEKQRTSVEITDLKKRCKAKADQAEVEIQTMNETKEKMRRQVEDYHRNIKTQLQEILLMAQKERDNAAALWREEEERTDALRKKHGLPLRNK